MHCDLYIAKLPTVFKEKVRIYEMQKLLIGQRDPVGTFGVQSLPVQMVRTLLLKAFFEMLCTRGELFPRDV